MPFSPCCKRKYSKPCRCCKCCPPPSDCEFVEQSSSPPCTTEEDDAASVQFFTPVVAAAPVSNKCCCSEVKPKKSFWQQLFGDRKCCCAPKKKQDCCCCKPNKKPKCVPECVSAVYRSDSRRPSTITTKTCKPCCCNSVRPSKEKSSFKPCCPSPDTVFGCRFYCNVENCKPKRQPQCRCCCTCSSPETTDVTTEDEKVRRSSQRANNNKVCNCCTKTDKKPPKPCKPCHCKPCDGKPVKPPTPVKPTTPPVKPTTPPVKPPTPPVKPPPFPEPPIPEKPSMNNIHIGLTFTNTETKYYKNSQNCPPQCVSSTDKEGGKYSNEENCGSSSSEQVITLEIHQSEDEIVDDKNGKRESNYSRDKDTSSYSSKRRRLSALKEENETSQPNTESSQEEEIMPKKESMGKNSNNSKENRSGSPTMSREKSNRSGSPTMSREKTIHRSVSPTMSREKTINRSVSPTMSREKTINSVMLNNDEIDNRVSEILRRLKTIENKINHFGSKVSKKSFNTEHDDDRSITSTRLRDGKHSERTVNNDYKKSGKSHRKPDAIIEIRKCRSQSYSPVRQDSSSQNSRYRYSQSVDRSSRGRREKPKLVIKLPNGHKVSEGVFTMSSSKKEKTLDHRDSEWMKVSNELKSRKPENCPCYCYECVCKRIACKSDFNSNHNKYYS